MLKILKFSFLVVCGALMLSACTSTIPMSPENRAKIKTVSVDRTVEKPKQVTYMAPRAGLFVLGGIAGAVAGAGMSESELTKLEQKAGNRHLDIRNIVYESFKKQLIAQHLFKVTAAHASATIRLKIKTYGFYPTNSLSSEVHPMLRLEARAYDRGNKMIWQAGDYVSNYADTKGYKPDEFLKHPEKMRQAWQQAADIASKNILETLKPSDPTA